jgi:hypothetical protein
MTGRYALTELATVDNTTAIALLVALLWCRSLPIQKDYAGRRGIYYSSVPFIDQSGFACKVEISREVVSIGKCMIGDDGGTQMG